MRRRAVRKNEALSSAELVHPALDARRRGSGYPASAPSSFPRGPLPNWSRWSPGGSRPLVRLPSDDRRRWGHPSWAGSRSSAQSLPDPAAALLTVCRRDPPPPLPVPRGPVRAATTRAAMLRISLSGFPDPSGAGIARSAPHEPTAALPPPSRDASRPERAPDSRSWSS